MHRDHLPSLENPEGTAQEISQRLMCAYLKGRHRQRADPIEEAKQAWWASLQAYSKSRLTSSQRRIAALCKRYCAGAIAAAQRLDVNTSCQLFGMARQCVSSDELGEEGRLLCRSELSAAESHLDVACRDYESARARLLQALELDEELETRFNYRLLHVHRIHLLGRMVNLMVKRHGVSEALDLAARTIHYLDTGETPAFPGHWGSEHLSYLPEGALQFLYRQIAVEVAAALVDQGAGVAHRAIRPVIHRDAFREAANQWDPISREWFILKSLYLEECGSIEYLEQCVAFFENGPRNAVSLWLLTAMDAARASRRLCPSQALPFCTALAADLRITKAFPAGLRSAWSASLTR